MDRKGLDCIVVNRIGFGRVGFASDDADIVILWPGGGREAVGPASKSAVAGAILDRIAALRKDR
jgi:phosphopantothenoylcysteine synthetase/decarboxylase